MIALAKETTILFPPKLYRRLEKVAREQKRSVGALVRDAVEIQYGEGGLRARLEAVERLARLNAPTGSPDRVEKEIERGALEM
ncbi:MAG: hypothetical protein HY721_03080 [Planctomycetes bacterium]|nr:hypothetical protein [Planctomycetota bacterium]